MRETSVSKDLRGMVRRSSPATTQAVSTAYLIAEWRVWLTLLAFLPTPLRGDVSFAPLYKNL